MRRIERWMCLGTTLTAATVALAAKAAGPDQAEAAIGHAERSGSATGPALQIVSLGLLFLLLVGLLVWVFYAYRRMADFRFQEQRAALELEAQVGSLISTRRRQSPSGPTEGAAVSSGAAWSPAALPDASAGTPEVAAVAADASNGSTEGILSKLQSAGLLVGVEGMLYLSDGRTEARIVRLTNSKAALLMPRLDSAAFLARQLRRFDLCMMPLEGDSIGVIAPFGAYIADHFSM